MSQISNNEGKTSYCYSTVSQINSKVPKFVRIVEVGARDGLQNEQRTIPTSVKVDLIHRLSECGLTTIEATSFVNPKAIPQMADASKLYPMIKKKDGVSYPVLVPNLIGYENAKAVNATQEIAVFASASESFSHKNIGCSIEKSFDRFSNVLEAAKKDNVKVRGYVSCVAGCPYEGDVDPVKVAQVAKFLYEKGCYEISLGDTIGIGTPGSIARMIEEVSKVVPVERLAGHYHDTYGQALSNILASLQLGVSVFDSSVAGLGGCPFARGATGNVATEDVVYMLHGMGIETGIDLDKLIDVGEFVSAELGRTTASRVANAIINKRRMLQLKSQSK